MIYTSQHLPLTAGARHTDTNYIYTITLTAGSDAATLKIYDGVTASDYQIYSLAAVTGTSTTVTFNTPLQVVHGIFVAITGTGAAAWATVDSAVLSVRPSSSVSSSLSPSSSNSPSRSPSLSPSSSQSPSNSPSNSPSLSPSSSLSPSVSPSV